MSSFACPIWPQCGCPDGTVRADCPALAARRLDAPAVRRAPPPLSMRIRVVLAALAIGNLALIALAIWLAFWPGIR